MKTNGNTFKCPDHPAYIHHQVGSDRYCYKVVQVESDGKAAYVCPVVWKGPESWLNRGELTTLDSATVAIVWKYGSWKTLDGRRLSRKHDFDSDPSPFMDPSF